MLASPRVEVGLYWNTEPTYQPKQLPVEMDALAAEQ